MGNPVREPVSRTGVRLRIQVHTVPPEIEDVLQDLLDGEGNVVLFRKKSDLLLERQARGPRNEGEGHEMPLQFAGLFRLEHLYRLHPHFLLSEKMRLVRLRVEAPQLLDGQGSAMQALQAEEGEVRLMDALALDERAGSGDFGFRPRQRRKAAIFIRIAAFIIELSPLFAAEEVLAEDLACTGIGQFQRALSRTWILRTMEMTRRIVAWSMYERAARSQCRRWEFYL